MPAGIKLSKAYIVNRKTGTVIAVQYNPTELAVKKSVPWSAAEKGHVDTNIPKQDFKKGEGVGISLKLEYDTSGADGQGPAADDVRTVGHFADLMELTRATTESGRTMPPLIDFSWGAGFNDKLGTAFGPFVGVVKSLNINYTRFNPDGVPTRASVQVDLIEVNPGDEEYANHGGSSAGGSPPPEQDVDRSARIDDGR